MDKNVESPRVPDSTQGSHSDGLRPFLINHMLYSQCDPHFWMRKLQSRKINWSAQVTQLIRKKPMIRALSPHVQCSLMATQLQKYQCQLRSQLSMNLNQPTGHVPDDIIPVCFYLWEEITLSFLTHSSPAGLGQTSRCDPLQEGMNPTGTNPIINLFFFLLVGG